MPTSLQIAQLVSETTTQITGSYQNWTSFLRSAARLYKYPFSEQLMIYAQRPDATACADFQFWNERMYRSIRRGASGIALLDTRRDVPTLRYIFDISDTVARRRDASQPYLWQLRPEHEEAVAAFLESSYHVPVIRSLPEQFINIASQMAEAYWDNYQKDILPTVEDTFLDDYDDYGVGVQFRNAVTASVSYTLMSRCDIETGPYFTHEDFTGVFNWNTPDAIIALGTAVSEISQTVLLQIERTVKQYERAKRTERTSIDESDISDKRRLSHSRSESKRNTTDSFGQIRTAAQAVSSAVPSHSMEQAASLGEAIPTFTGDRRNSEPEVNAVDVGIDGSQRRALTV